MIEMATEATTQLAGLVALARRHNADGRRVILENVADLFLSPDERPSERESALMTDILHKLVHDVEMTVRRNFSERLAGRSPGSDVIGREPCEAASKNINRLAIPSY